MKGGIFALVALTAVTLGGNAEAQESVPTAPVPTVAPDSAPLPTAAPIVNAVPLAVHQLFGVTSEPVVSAESSPFAITLQEAGLKGRFFGTKRRTSNTLMIGGVALAGIGVGVVKGDIGAIMGMAGLFSTIGGLYLAF